MHFLKNSKGLSLKLKISKEIIGQKRLELYPLVALLMPFGDLMVFSKLPRPPLKARDDATKYKVHCSLTGGGLEGALI